MCGRIMEKPPLVSFVDLDSGDDACVLVRAVAGAVGLTLTLRDNGDLGVFMPPEVARQVAALLSQAAEDVQERGRPR